MIKALGAAWLAFLIYADGWATWVFFHRKNRRVEQKSLDPGGLLGQVVIGVILTGCITLALALAGVYNAWSYSGCCLAYALVTLAAARPGAGLLKAGLPVDRSIIRKTAPIALCLLVGAALILPPFMFVFGSADEGVYPNTAGNIARSGSVFLKDPVIPTVGEERFNWFYKHYYRVEDGERVPWFDNQELGFYITDIRSGTVTPQFLHFYPACMAALMTFLGVRGGFLILTLLCLISVWALYLIAEELMDRWAALAAAVFLIVNFLEVYFGKFSTAEIPAQGFFTAGLCFFVLYRREAGSGGGDANWYAFLSGAAFGAMFHTHLLSFLFLAPLGVLYLYYFAARGWEGIRRDGVFLVTFGAFLAALLGLFFWPYRTYGLGISMSVAKKLSGPLIIGALVLAVAVGLVVLLRLLEKDIRAFAIRNRKLLMGLACALIVAMFVFAAFVWPALTRTENADPAVRSYRSSTLVRLSYYMTPVGIALALLGYCLFLLKDADEGTLIIPLAGLAFTAVVAYRPLVNQILPWAMRRFVQVAVPVAVLMAVYALYSLWRWRPPAGRHARRLRAGAVAVSAGAAAALLVMSILVTAHVTKLPGNRQSYPVTRRISDLAKGGGLIVCDKKSGRLLPAPLRCLMGRRVLRLRENLYARDPWFADFIRKNAAEGGPVHLVVYKDSGSLEHFGDFRLVPVGGATYRSTVLEPSFEPTTRSVDFQADFLVYTLEPPGR